MYGFYKSQRRWDGFNVYSLYKRINAEMERISKATFEPYVSEFTLKCEVGSYYASAEVVGDFW